MDKEQRPFHWEHVFSDAPGVLLTRAKVPGGWFVHVTARAAPSEGADGTTHRIFFYPDPQHIWDGGTLL